MKAIISQFTKYGIVGVIGAIITSYGNILFQWLGLSEYIDPLNMFPIPWSLGFAILCAMVSNFILNKYWTFASSDKK